MRFHYLTIYFLALALAGTAALPSSIDEWDDLDSPVQKTDPVKEVKVLAAAGSPTARPRSLKEKSIPYMMISFLLSSLLVTIIGGRGNAKLTLAFEENFCQEPDGILWKQFTRLGRGGKNLLVTESPSTFKLHANGHKHLEGAVLTLTLLRRHELVSCIGQYLTGQEDILCMEFFVKEGYMPAMVLAIATPTTYKELLKNHQDVKLLTHKLEVKGDKMKDWPAEDLTVFAEHSSYFYDMMTKPMLSQVFGGVAFQRQKRFFRGLQITSESSCSHRKVIRFWLRLPKAEEIGMLNTLMTAAFALVNQVGNYSISAERQKQADQARQEFVKQTGRTEPTAFAKEVIENRKTKAKRKGA